MAAKPVKHASSAAAESPLERISVLLGDDMKKVNALILQNLQSEVPLIPQVGAWLIAAGGKRIRPLLTLASTRLYGNGSDRPFGLAAAVEFIHTATLLHDDVVDESIERRGQDSANVVFGNQASVLVGDFLFSRSFQLMVADGSLEVLRILSDAAAIIAQGEVMQLTTARNIETTMDEYLAVIKAKTAALFAAACEIGPLLAGYGQDEAAVMAEYGLNLGIAFQIADDVLDYSADQEKLGKTVGDDFREGKMTAPVLLALQAGTPEERNFWARTMTRDDGQTPHDLVEAQKILKKHKAFERGLDMAREYAGKARQALAEAPDGPLRGLLDEIAIFAVDRSH
ncbi:MAG TPA: polyprenyl synthetase family protein [Patescibacteria group bacterium]|nr:polyprenyl synthetase family protein [Patescibacteria group bacterium]